VVLPVDVFERGYTGAQLSAAEEEMYRSYPQVSSQLLSNIPRMEMVAAMVLHQHRDPDPGQVSLTGAAAQGALMLRIAQGLDRRMLRSTAIRDALGDLRREHGANGKEIIAALDDYRPPLAVMERKLVRVFELHSSMIVEDDVVTRDGIMIIGRETCLNPMLIDRVQNFSKTRGVCQPIRVRILRNDRAPLTA
jgi:hypothetical protein